MGDLIERLVCKDKEAGVERGEGNDEIMGNGYDDVYDYGRRIDDRSRACLASNYEYWIYS